MVAGMRQNRGRTVLLTQHRNFPTDLYIAQGLASLMGGGYALRLVERSEIEAALDTDIAWIRRHTEFGEEARHWSFANRPNGLLLRSPALEAAHRCTNAAAEVARSTPCWTAAHRG